MELIDKNELILHKFLMPDITVVGRGNGKTKELVSQIYRQGWNDAIDAIIDNAKVVEERQRAEWVYVQYDANPEIGNWHCSNCRCMPYYAKDIHTLKFCPECGADMKEGEDE